MRRSEARASQVARAVVASSAGAARGLGAWRACRARSRLIGRDFLAQPGDLRREAIGLGGLPAGLANGALELPRGDPVRFLGGAALTGGRRLPRAGLLERLPGGGRGGIRVRERGRRRLRVSLEPRDVRAEPFGARAAFDRAVRGPASEPDDGLADDRRAVADDGHPAGRQRRLQPERRVEVRDDDGPPEQPRRRPDRVAPDRIDRPRTAANDDRVDEPRLRGREAVGTRRACRRDDEPPLGRQVPDRGAVDEIRARRLVERGLDRGTALRVDLELLVDPPSAPPSGGLRDAPGLFLGERGVDAFEPAALRGEQRPGGGDPLRGGLAVGLGAIGGGPCLLAGRGCRCLRRGGGLDALPGGGRAILEPGPFAGRDLPRLALRGRSPFRVREPAPGGLRLRLARSGRSTQRGRLLAPRLSLRPQPAQLRERLRERPFRVRERRVERGVAARHGSREEPALQLEIALRRRPLVGEAGPVASDRVDLAAPGEPTGPEVQRAPRGLRREPRAALARPATARRAPPPARRLPPRPPAAPPAPRRRRAPRAPAPRPPAWPGPRPRASAHAPRGSARSRGPRRRSVATPAARPGPPAAGPAAGARRGCPRRGRGCPRTRRAAPPPGAGAARGGERPRRPRTAAAAPRAGARAPGRPCPGR